MFFFLANNLFLLFYRHDLFKADRSPSGQISRPKFAVFEGHIKSKLKEIIKILSHPLFSFPSIDK